MVEDILRVIFLLERLKPWQIWSVNDIEGFISMRKIDIAMCRVSRSKRKAQIYLAGNSRLIGS